MSYIQETEHAQPSRKRSRSEADLSFDDPVELRPLKRLKSCFKIHSPEFYDSRPKLWLTRRALKEFDRRNSLLSWSGQPVFEIPIDIGNIYDTKQIQKFARHGGPDLGDLRAVSPYHCSSHGNADYTSIHSYSMVVLRLR